MWILECSRITTKIETHERPFKHAISVKLCCNMILGCISDVFWRCFGCEDGLKWSPIELKEAGHILSELLEVLDATWGGTGGETISPVICCNSF